jgi:NTE family protein
VPELFEAVEIDGDYYWDGLFSQNPPIRDHFEGPVERKPDELWVVQISPQSRDERPRSPRAITDRRSELAGNLSLNQELRFVEHINDLVDEGRLDGEYKHTTVRRITLDRDLSRASRFDRRPSFLATLFADGTERAESFLADRGYTSTSTS